MDGGGPASVLRILQPSYVCTPSHDGRFVSNRVKAAVQPIVDDLLKDQSWSKDEQANKGIAHGLCNTVLETVKNLEMQRYKLVVQITVGENLGQTVRIASQCLWEPEMDNIAEINYKSDKLWCSIVVIGFYTH